MTLMEKLVEKGQALGYKTATQLFSAAGVNSNAQLTCNRKGTLSNTNKQRLARVLKISVGDINSMMAAALREANAEKSVPLQAKMLDTAKADLRQVCENYLETDSLDFIESVHKISGEIIKMKEGEE